MRNNFFLMILLFAFSSNGGHAQVANDFLENGMDNQFNSKKIDYKKLKKEDLVSIVLAQNESINDINKKYRELSIEVEKQNEKNVNLDFPIWTSILLGCVGVLVTVLGVTVAILSIFGYKKIKDTATTIAESKTVEIATTVATDVANTQLHGIASREVARLIAEGELREELERAVDMILRRNLETQNETGFNKYPELD